MSGRELETPPRFEDCVRDCAGDAVEKSQRNEAELSQDLELRAR